MTTHSITITVDSTSWNDESELASDLKEFISDFSIKSLVITDTTSPPTILVSEAFDDGDEDEDEGDE